MALRDGSEYTRQETVSGFLVHDGIGHIILISGLRLNASLPPFTIIEIFSLIPASVENNP